MKKRSDKQKEAMGLLSPIFRELNIKQDVRGYEPLMDLISYAYANPNVGFKNIMEMLGEVFYIGVRETKAPEEIEAKIRKESKKAMEDVLRGNNTVEEVEEKVAEKIRHIKTTYTENAKLTLFPAMKRCIATVLERTKKSVLRQYGLEELTIILKDGNPIEEAKIKEELPKVIGKQYLVYETYEERIIVFFAEKLLERIQSK